MTSRTAAALGLDRTPTPTHAHLPAQAAVRRARLEGALPIPLPLPEAPRSPSRALRHHLALAHRAARPAVVPGVVDFELFPPDWVHVVVDGFRA